MQRSYSETTTIKCPKCKQQMSVEIWRIVDTRKRPDLFERICGNEIHRAACKECGYKGRTNAPLLIHVPEMENVLYVQSDKISKTENRKTRAMLVKKLAASFQNVPEYLDTVEILDHKDLPIVFRKSIVNSVQTTGELEEKSESESSKTRTMRNMEENIPERVHSMISEISGLTQRQDMPYLIELCRQALSLINRVDHPVTWANLSTELGIGLIQNPFGNHSESIEQGIECFSQALEIMSRDAAPMAWAKIMESMALAYYFRIQGDRAQNIETSIRYYQQVLEVNTRYSVPMDWASTMMNLAVAYSVRVHGNRADNIEEAIKCFEHTLEVNTRDTMPMEWAEATMNLATAYRNRIRGNPSENIEKAIHCYQQALEMRTRDAMPVDWAMTMLNLGVAYLERIQGNHAMNIEQAIQCFEQALEMIPRHVMAVEWAKIVSNLATAIKTVKEEIGRKILRKRFNTASKPWK